MLGIIEAAHAEPVAAIAGKGFNGPMTIVLWVGVLGLMYLLLLRPQMKRNKEHRKLIDNLSLTDKVMTTAGIIGEIKKVNGQYIQLEIAQDVIVTVQRQTITAVLPKDFDPLANVAETKSSAKSKK